MTTSDRDLTWLTSVLRGEASPRPVGDDPAATRRVVDLAQAEGVAVLCFERLRRRDDPPKALLASLRPLAQRHAALELVRELELQRVLPLLGAASLRPLLMKGTALAYTLYPEPYLRMRCDTDLLFPDQQSADRAWELLRQLGYHRNNAVSGEYISQEFACHRADAMGITHTLDIHWKPSNDIAFADKLRCDELARAARPVPALGPHALAPAPVHSLIVACLHRMQHAAEGPSNRLIWLYDIHLLSQALRDAEWSAWLNLASARGLSSICLDGLLAAKACFSTPVPAAVLATLTASAAGDWLTPKGFSSTPSRFLTALRALPDWRSRLQWAREHLFPDARYMLAKYDIRDTRLLPFLYLRRLLTRLAKFLLQRMPPFPGR